MMPEIMTIKTKLGEVDEAAKLFMMIAILYQDDVYTPKALWHAAQSFESTKNRKKAISVYEELIQRYPNHEYAISSQKRLEANHESAQ